MKKIKIVLLLIPTIILAGCWDMVEINQRTYPYSFGVDLIDNEKENLSLIITYPNIKALGKNPSQEDKTYILKAQGTSIFDATRKLSTETRGPFYFKHLRVLVLGEDAAKNKKIVNEIMDGLMRDYIINKRVLITVVEDKAEKLLESLPGNVKQEFVEGTLFGLLLNAQNATYFTPNHLSDFIDSMDKKGASIVPLLLQENDTVKASGGGIFKDYALVGYIDGKENEAISILDGKAQTTAIDINYKGDIISLNTDNIESKKKLLPNDESLKIKYNIQVEGSIQEYKISEGGALIKTVEKINEIEEMYANQLKAALDNIINVLQKDFKADALGIGEYLSKYHPKLWKEVKDDWENVFADIEIELDIEVKIRRRGLIN